MQMFHELANGAKYRFPPKPGGELFTKLSKGGKTRNSAGEEKWCASHNFVLPCNPDGTPIVEAPAPAPDPDPEDE